MQLTYDPGLVEEAVLLWERMAPPADTRIFRRERDRLYDIDDEEGREAGFQALHRRWFVQLELAATVELVVAERSDLATRVQTGRVLRAVTRRDEGADLVDPIVSTEAAGQPILVLRLRPETLLDPAALVRLLRHDLMHVADMLDPAFGYERALPPSQDGPSADNILRDRYRVLWDVTIDGRLARRGLADGRSRQERAREFAATFPMRGGNGERAFAEWFDRIEPTHAQLLAFAMSAESDAGVDSGRCPVCRFPVASLDPRASRLSTAVRAAISREFPSWHVGQGLCSLCLDRFEARYGETSDVCCR
jgi:hypothetical protein